jgi:hypothetical protein
MCTTLYAFQIMHFLFIAGINAYKCNIINFLLTSLTRYVQRNIGPRSFCKNLALQKRPPSYTTSCPGIIQTGTPKNFFFFKFDSVVFILTCLYCKIRVVRTKVWCKMAGVTFDFHDRYHYLALTWFACKWLVVSN